MQPDADKFGLLRTDTFTIETMTVREDTLRSDELSLNPIGSIRDPYFGTSRSKYFGHILLPEDNLSFGTSPQLDSVVLTLAYNAPADYYGNPLDVQAWDVYEMGEEIRFFDDYFSNHQFALGTQLASWSGNFNLSDSVKVGAVNQAPHLRIKLDNTFGQKILAAGTNLVDNPTFISYIKGIGIVPSNTAFSGTGAQVYFNLSSSLSNVTIYYNDTSKKDFPLSSVTNRVAARINTFDHDYTGRPVDHYINQKGNFDTAWVQSQGGLKTKITIPGLYNLLDQAKNGAIAIHGAELKMKVVGKSSVPNGFTYPSNLLLVQMDSSGMNAKIIDRIYEGSTYTYAPGYYGGAFDASTGMYKFNLVQQIQNMLTTYMNTGKKRTEGFYIIIPSDYPVSAGRLMLDTHPVNNQTIIQGLISIEDKQDHIFIHLIESAKFNKNKVYFGIPGNLVQP